MPLIRFKVSPSAVISNTSYTVASLPLYRRTTSGKSYIIISGNGAIYINPSRYLPSITWNLSFSNQGNAIDLNLSTYASYSLPANTSETIAVTIDALDSRKKAVFVRIGTYSSSLYMSFYRSPDGSTWTLLGTTNDTYTTLGYVGTDRYYRITATNPTSYSYLVYVYEILVYDLTSCEKVESVDQTVDYKVVVHSTQSITLVVEPVPTLVLSYFESLPPTSMDIFELIS